MATQSDQALLVTGGAQRVGREIALYFAARGWHIAVHYNQSATAAADVVAQCEAQGVRATAVAADFSADFDAAALLQQAQETVGPLTCLINSAAIIEKDGLDDLTHAAFHRHQQINCFAPLKLIQAFAAHVTAHGQANASIVNLADGMLGWSLSPLYLSYALSKYGVFALTECLAGALAPAIRINTVGVGLTLPNSHDGPDTFDRLARQMPLQRPSSPQEICETIAYLLAAPSVTGQHILLNGGKHLPG